MYDRIYEGRRIMLIGAAAEKKRRKRMIYKRLSRFVTWIGLGAAGLIAIPAGILILLISGIWTVADRFAAYLERKGDD